LREGVPVLLPEEDGYTSHIHADDLAGQRSCRIAPRKAGEDLPRLRRFTSENGEYFDL